MSNNETPKQSLEGPDLFLESLVNLVTGSGWEVGLTLQVGGFLVSGLLVSGRAFLEALGTEFSSALPNEEAAAAVRKSYSELADKIYGESSEARQNRPVYIHLKNARFFSSNGAPIPANRGLWWRGRLTEVQGFVLGSLSQS
jgi:hypothetical protein